MTAITPYPIPELGPLLSRLAAPDAPTDRDSELEPIRLDMLSSLFDHASRARARIAAGDPPGARGALSGQVWLDIWNKAVSAATISVLSGTERRLREAARLSRLPAKKLRTLLPGEEDRRILAARLSSAGSGLERTVRDLDRDLSQWGDVLRRVAAEFSGAWYQLGALARLESAFWERRITDIRAWRRPWRPLVVMTSVLVAIASWLGLVFGGYLPVPGFLEPLANLWWGLPWPS